MSPKPPHPPVVVSGIPEGAHVLVAQRWAPSNFLPAFAGACMVLKPSSEAGIRILHFLGGVTEYKTLDSQEFSSG